MEILYLTLRVVMTKKKNSDNVHSTPYAHIYSFTRYLLRTYYMPGLSGRNKEENKRDVIPDFMEVTW